MERGGLGGATTAIDRLRARISLMGGSLALTRGLLSMPRVRLSTRPALPKPWKGER